MDKEYVVSKLEADLKYFGHDVTRDGVKFFVDESVEHKSELTALLEKMEGYNGNNQVIIEETFDRDVSPVDVQTLIDRCTNGYTMTRYHNPEGKTLGDFVKTDLGKSFNVLDMLEKNIEKIQAVVDFDRYGQYIPSVNRQNQWSKCCNYMRGHYEPTLSDIIVERMNNICPELKFNKGMKTSRAVTRMFVVFGIIRENLQNIKADERTDAEKRFFKDFTAYADMINPIKLKRKVVISTNPIDYLKMSFGHNWCSCHNIDQRNKRMTKGLYPAGINCAGTVSYALDSTSFIMYALPIDADSSHPEDYDKIYRCMFHYHDGNLIQGRVYPQEKDGGLDLYRKLRHIMQGKLCEALDVPFINNGGNTDSWKQCGQSYSKRGMYNNGTYYIDWASGEMSHQYPDYNHAYSGNAGNVSFLKTIEHTDISPMIIGHQNVCLKCGKYEDYDHRIDNSRLVHYEGDCEE